MLRAQEEVPNQSKEGLMNKTMHGLRPCPTLREVDDMQHFPGTLQELQSAGDSAGECIIRWAWRDLWSAECQWMTKSSEATIWGANRKESKTADISRSIQMSLLRIPLLILLDEPHLIPFSCMGYILQGCFPVPDRKWVMTSEVSTMGTQNCWVLLSTQNSAQRIPWNLNHYALQHSILQKNFMIQPFISPKGHWCFWQSSFK